MTLHHRWCAAVALLAAACSSDPAGAALDAALADAVSPADLGAAPDLTDLGTPAVDVPVTIDVPAAIDAAAPPYPDGPYGNRMGNVLANLDWVGYVNPTAEGLSNRRPYGPTSLQAMRGNGRGYALVHVSEFL